MSDEIDDVEELPAVPATFAEAHPDVWERYAELGEASSDAGPIDGETKRLVKLALAIGAESEGAVHSHARRGLEEGVSREAMEHVAILSITTMGFPQAMAALSWIDDVEE